MVSRMGLFQDTSPSLESFWRAIILFGRNSASYSFALAKALLHFCSEERTFVSLDELAKPFALELCEHLKFADRQGNRPTGPFLDSCRKYNSGELGIDRLCEVTAARGFRNVIDAFHMVAFGEIPVRFFADERKVKNGISITDALLSLKASVQFSNLTPETEARWRLVETSWGLRVSRSVLAVNVDPETNVLFVPDPSLRRPSITSCRDALDGYQKGKCFYCFRDVSIDAGSPDLADVDHFFPRRLFTEFRRLTNLDGVWNLVLACRSCNRGEQGKFDQLPKLRYLERLHTRNSFLIDSHLPLRETLMAQMGATDAERAAFLQRVDSVARERLIHRWSPREEAEPVF